MIERMNTSRNNRADVNPRIPDSANSKTDSLVLWTTPEVSRYLHVSAKTVFNLRQRGLPYLAIGGAVRFDPQEIKNYLTAHRRLATHRLRQKVRKGKTV